VRSEKLGRANMELLIRSYNEPTGPRTTLSFGDRILELDREDVEAIAHYYDNVLKDDNARWNFISGVMSDPDGLNSVLVKLGRRKPQSIRQPGLFQEENKKKDDEVEPQVRDVALQRAITRAKADFPTAGSGLEALAKGFMRSQDEDQKSFDQIRQAERQQDQMLSQIAKIDQEQEQEIQGLEQQNSTLANRLQQLQNVNSKLEKKLADMSGRKSEKKSKSTSAAAPTTAAGSVNIAEPKSEPKTEPKAKSKSTTAPKVSYKINAIPKATKKSDDTKELPEPTSANPMSQMAKQLTTQHPDVLEPAADFVKGNAPRFNTSKATTVEPRAPTPQEMPGDVAQNVNAYGNAMTGSNLKNTLDQYRKDLATNENDDQEADYDDKYQDMVKRMGQKAREQEKNKPVDIADLARRLAAIEASRKDK